MAPGVRVYPAEFFYHLPEVVEAVAAGRTVYLCEGEKDADAMRQAYAVLRDDQPVWGELWARDMLATALPTICGAQTWSLCRTAIPRA